MDPKPRRSKDPSLKARKDLFFDDTPDADTPRKPFKEYLRDTPSAPLPPLVKAGLWAAGVVVALLLLAAMYRLSRSRKPTAPPAHAARAVVSERPWG